jgi:hypothetical protein
MILCQICGNEIKAGVVVCLFCASPQASEDRVQSQGKAFAHRTVNLERGMPFVEPAMQHLQAVLRESREMEIQALTLIHGYGSSGKGGAIRRECRKTLDYMCSRGELNSYIPGEDFNRRSGPVKDLLNRYPQLAANKNLNKNNPGITVIIF